MSKIEEALNKRFLDHRVIFWYDEKEELSEEFSAIEIDGVTKIQVQGNEFEIKYIISKQKPEGKFLLYFTGTKPDNEENWLLDMELAHYVFHTDQEALYLQELGLGLHLKELVTEHLEFFKAKERRNKLAALLDKGDEHKELRCKLLAVVFETEDANLEAFIHAHTSSVADDNDRFDKKLELYNLTATYWKEISNKYNYQSETPSIYDFLFEVFNELFALANGKGLTRDSKLLVSHWKDLIKYRDNFRIVSNKIASDLNVETLLNEATLDDIITDDLFNLCDKKIIHELADLVTSESISHDKLMQYVKQRENKFWYPEFENMYRCLVESSAMISLVRKYAGTTYKEFNEGVEHYSSKLYKVDYSYRKFIWNYRKTNQNKILSDLELKVEKIYANDWLLNYSDNWQNVVQDLESWPNFNINSQQSFFAYKAKPVVSKNQRLFVIISDAFRYESGIELHQRLLAENRFDSKIEHLVSSIPSYTQLGMAALLPHHQLTIQRDSDTVEVDGVPSTGIYNRGKILDVLSGVRASAINAEDFMKLNSSTEGRDYVKKYDLIYIYHNRIDKVGDDKTSENKVFEAVEEEIVFLMDVVKKIANMNGTNMMITSDHGYSYQHNLVSESDFSYDTPTGYLWKLNRRFVIGEGLKEDKSTKLFKGKDLNIKTDVDVIFPKGFNRFRIKGAGSKFIHGGTSLQEIIIPLLNVTKKRKDTTSFVDIDIIKSTDKITTNILPVSFIQSDLATENILPRSVRAYLIADDGEILSDQFKYNFDIEEGSERLREVKHRFQLSSKAASAYKNQRVRLLIEEPVEGTTKWKLYKDFYYTLNISFTNDFD